MMSWICRRSWWCRGGQRNQGPHSIPTDPRTPLHLSSPTMAGSPAPGASLPSHLAGSLPNHEPYCFTSWLCSGFPSHTFPIPPTFGPSSPRSSSGFGPILCAHLTSYILAEQSSQPHFMYPGARPSSSPGPDPTATAPGESPSSLGAAAPILHTTHWGASCLILPGSWDYLCGSL